MTATAAPTGSSASPGSRDTTVKHREGLWIALVVYLLYTTYALTRWRQHRVAGFDLGVFDQAVRNYGHFRAPIISLKAPGYNALGDHFHPIIAVLGPLYRIWDDARVLLIAQAALVALSVWVVHRYAARHLDRRTAGFAAVAYALGWPLQNMVDFDFHEIAFGIPLLALAIDALDRRSDRALLVSAFLLLLVREDMGLIVAALGLVRLRLRPRWPGWLLVVVGPVVFFVVTKVVIPHFGFFTYWTYWALGPDLPSALVFVVSHPLDTLGMFLSPPVKVSKLLMLFLPVAFLALRSPYVLPVVPLLAESLLSARPDLWGTRYHHSSVLWPIIFLAAVDGAVRLGLPQRLRLWRAVRVVVIGFPLVGLLTGGADFPLHRLLDGSAFPLSDHMRDQAEVVAGVPAGTCVEADDNLDVLLTHTNLVTVRGALGRPPDFYALDLRKTDMVGVRPDEVRRLALEAGYTTALASGAVVLLQRPGYRGPTPDCAPS